MYTVRNLEDSVYQVLFQHEDSPEYEYDVMFQGSLANCEAWIRLNEKGLLE